MQVNELVITSTAGSSGADSALSGVHQAASGSAVNPVALLLADKRSAQTRRAYTADLAAFFGGNPTPGQVAAFVGLSTPQIALRLATYKSEMLAQGLAEATVNRRLSAVRSLLKFCARLGMCATDGRGLVDGERVQAYRDTRGIDVKQMKKLLGLPDVKTLLGKRDAALLRLLCENALRRAEVCALDVPDFEPVTRRLLIIGKGKGTQKLPVTVSARLVGVLTLYLLEAKHEAGPLFRNAAGGRLTSDGLYKIVGGYGDKLGISLAPHKLRHSAITAALDATNGDVRKVQKLSRHAKIETLLRYDDAREDFQGEVTGALSKLL